MTKRDYRASALAHEEYMAQAVAETRVVVCRCSCHGPDGSPRGGGKPNYDRCCLHLPWWDFDREAAK